MVGRETARLLRRHVADRSPGRLSEARRRARCQATSTRQASRDLPLRPCESAGDPGPSATWRGAGARLTWPTIAPISRARCNPVRVVAAAAPSRAGRRLNAGRYSRTIPSRCRASHRGRRRRWLASPRFASKKRPEDRFESARDVALGARGRCRPRRGRMRLPVLRIVHDGYERLRLATGGRRSRGCPGHPRAASRAAKRTRIDGGVYDCPQPMRSLNSFRLRFAGRPRRLVHRG